MAEYVVRLEHHGPKVGNREQGLVESGPRVLTDGGPGNRKDLEG